MHRHWANKCDVFDYHHVKSEGDFEKGESYIASRQRNDVKLNYLEKGDTSENIQSDLSGNAPEATCESEPTDELTDYFKHFNEMMGELQAKINKKLADYKKKVDTVSTDTISIKDDCDKNHTTQSHHIQTVEEDKHPQHLAETDGDERIPNKDQGVSEEVPNKSLICSELGQDDASSSLQAPAAATYQSTLLPKYEKKPGDEWIQGESEVSGVSLFWTYQELLPRCKNKMKSISTRQTSRTPAVEEVHASDFFTYQELLPRCKKKMIEPISTRQKSKRIFTYQELLPRCRKKVFSLIHV